MSQSAIARQLNEWQVAPQPDRLTELYFANHLRLPATAPMDAVRSFDFTVHNLEFKTIQYHYRVVAKTAESNTEHLLTQGDLLLSHGESKTIPQAITLPPLGARILVAIQLSYDSILPGGTEPTPQIQSIHHWVRLEHGARR